MTQATEDWDRLDATTFWQPMPPSNLAEALSGEPGSLFVRGAVDGWWVQRPDQDRQDGPYPSAQAAMQAGNSILEETWVKTPERLLAASGLSTEDWTLSLENGVCLTSLRDPSVSIQMSRDGIVSV